MDGLTGLVLEVVARLGAVGVGLLTLVETVFPPIPSEVVLPLAGYQVERGRLGLAEVLAASTIGSVLGAAVLYLAGQRLGEERAAALLGRLPLVEAEDVHRATRWFDTHGRWAVLVGRLVPGVRSLISIPAGASRMRWTPFLVLTTVGSFIWNTLLVLGGVALGTQYELVEKYADVLDIVVISVVVGLVGWFVVRRLRTRRSPVDNSAA